MTDIELGRPWLLAALPLAPILLAVWWATVRRSARAGRLLSRGRPAGPPYTSAALLTLAAIAATIAAAQPRWGTQTATIPRQGADVVIVLDVSRSMDARDVEPSRLQAAKTSLNAMMERLGGDRVGLVVFGGTARIRFPLTTDIAAAMQVVSSLESDPVIVQGGSSASAGLLTAIDVFDPAQQGGKVIVLVTDGDDLGPDPAAAAEAVRAAGVDLLVVGAGTQEGGTIPVLDTAKRQLVDKLDASGRPIITRLNEPFLRALAAASEGRYVGANLATLPGSVQGRLATIERARVQRESPEIPIERYQWFAAAALLLMGLATLAEWVPRVFGRRAALGLVAALLLLPGCASRAWELNDQGREAYGRDDFERAAELFQEAQAERPDDADIALNLAAAMHRAGRYGDAIQAARRALLDGDPAVRARAYASIGHHRFEAGDLEAALEAFKQALILAPEDGASRHDYEVLLRLLTPEATPGDGEPEPGSEPPNEEGTGEPQSGEQPGPGDQQPGTPRPATPQELESRLAAIDAQIEALLDETGETPTAAEALEILDLLAERNRIVGARDALRGNDNPRDY